MVPEEIRGRKGVEENGNISLSVTASFDENDTDLFPSSPSGRSIISLSIKIVSLRNGYNNSSDIHIVDGCKNVVVDNEDEFGDNGATAHINLTE